MERINLHKQFSRFSLKQVTRSCGLPIVYPGEVDHPD